MALTNSKRTFLLLNLGNLFILQHHWEGGRKLWAPNWSSPGVYESSGLQDMSEMSRTVKVVSIAFRTSDSEGPWHLGWCHWKALFMMQRSLPYEGEGKVTLTDARVSTAVLVSLVEPSGSVQPLWAALHQWSMILPLLSSSRSELQLRFLMVGQRGGWFLWDVAGVFFVAYWTVPQYPGEIHVLWCWLSSLPDDVCGVTVF